MINEKVKAIIEKGPKEILIWGCKKNETKNLLEEFGIFIVGYIDKNYEKIKEYNGLKVFSSEILASKKFFVYVDVEETYEDIIKILEQYGYEEIKDFLYPNKKVILNGMENYKEDVYGNSLITNIKQPVKIELKNGGKIRLGNSIFENDVCIDVENSSIIIGDGNKIERECYIGAVDATVTIGENCIIEWGGLVRATCGGEINIKDKCYFNRFNIISASMNAKVVIEEDCMISNYVCIRAGNNHNIIDLETGENLDNNDKRNVFVDKHVWIGMRTTIMSGTILGKGCVVGANSFINKKYSKNSLIAGNPARTIRKKVAWHGDWRKIHDSIDDFLYYDFSGKE